MKNKRAQKDLLRVIAVGLFFVAAAFFFNSSYVRRELFDINNLRYQMKNDGWRDAVSFMLLAVVVNALGIPRIWVCAFAGSLFGALEGATLAFVATVLGASVNFFMGRILLRGPIERHLPVRLRRWYRALVHHGFSAILYLRLFPLTNGTLTNLLGGASGMKFRVYLLATALGYLPFTIAFATLGSSAAKQNLWQLLAGLLLFAGVAVMQWMWTRSKKTITARVNDDQTPHPDPIIDSQV